MQEPIFAAKSNAVDEDDGYILQLVNDAGLDKTFLYIFDAKNIGTGKGYECKIELMDEHVLAWIARLLVTAEEELDV